MARNRTKKRPGIGNALQLTYLGLEWCDGCGAHLDPGDRISGLCPECEEIQPETPVSKPASTRDDYPRED